jgi:hypothetical protein
MYIILLVSSAEQSTFFSCLQLSATFDILLMVTVRARTCTTIRRLIRRRKSSREDSVQARDLWIVSCDLPSLLVIHCHSHDFARDCRVNADLVPSQHAVLNPLPKPHIL